MPLAKPIAIDEVKKQVEACLQQNFTWFYSQNTGSTNSDLLQHKQAFSIAISESQSHGRGQGDNTWQSSLGSGLLFSIALNLTPSHNLALTPIKVGNAIKNVLNQHQYHNIQLKWPNDIFYCGKKVGGILIESITHHGQVLTVIGVGLNVNSDDKKNSFMALNTQAKDRTPLLINCLCAIVTGLNTADEQSVLAFNDAHLFHQKNIIFHHASNQSCGICQGINSHGQLLIQTQQGVEAHSTGHIVMDKDHALS